LPKNFKRGASGVTMTSKAKELVDRVRKAVAALHLPVLDEIYLADGNVIHVLREGKWVRGRSDHDIRFNQAAHATGILNARIFGRKKEQLGSVSLSGRHVSGSALSAAP
jgi:hypothetical protein